MIKYLRSIHALNPYICDSLIVGEENGAIGVSDFEVVVSASGEPVVALPFDTEYLS